MQSIKGKIESKTKKVTASSTLFGLSAAMFVTMIFSLGISMQNGISPAYGAIVAAFLTAIFAGLAIDRRSKERKA